MNFRIISKKIVIVVCILSLITPMVSTPFIARAQGMNVPIGTDFDFNNIMAHLKDFMLDRLAVMIANQILQRMTASVVNWINHGFEGQPSFLTNPEGFFLDVGDQVTGQFLHEIGASAICSPFGLDIQLALALNQVNYNTRNYTCTLSRAITNAQQSVERLQNGPRVNVTTSSRGATLGDFINGESLLSNKDAVSINNRSVDGFMNNFQSGSWPVFLSMAMEPQNNANGAYLQAQADLNARIAAREGKINNDLNRSNGFLSWESCKEVPRETMSDKENQIEYGLNSSQVAQLDKPGNQVTNSSKGSVFRKKENAQTMTTTYETCSTQTPGSVVYGTLQRQLNIPADKMVLVKTISDSIDAILGALVNQMITQGLAALSKSDASHGGRSYLKRLVDDSNSSSSQASRQARERLGSEANSLVNLANDSIAEYDKSIGFLNDSKTQLLAAKACYVNKIASSTPPLDATQKATAESQVGLIDATIATRIQPVVDSLVSNKTAAQSRIDELREAASSTTSGSNIQNDSPDDIAAQVDKLESYIGNVTKTTRAATTDAGAARQQGTVIKKQADDLNGEAKKYQTSCAQLIPTMTTTL